MCPSEVEYLGRKFIKYLALAHRQATPRIEQAMQRNGGYILHLDATHEADAPALMSGMDGLNQIVLANVKIPSEKVDHIAPFLRQLQSDYGDPIACVHDMGTGICKAIAQVFPGTRDFVCHFHFLRDAGKDLIDPAYAQLRKILRDHSATKELRTMARKARQHIDTQGFDATCPLSAITDGEDCEDMAQMGLVLTYLLALWCLQGKKSGNGYGFPFDRPLLEFARRLSTLNDCLPVLQQRLPQEDRIGNRLFAKFTRKVRGIVKGSGFAKVVEELEWRCRLFDDLREKMRIAEPGSRNGLNDEGTEKAMNSIRKGVLQFRSRLDKNRKFAGDALCQKVAEQIDKYGDRLFADPIEVNTPSGSVTVYPQRTNNMLEQFFRGLRRGHRRKTGDNSMRRVLQTMLADTPLVKNLDNTEYMKILLNGKERLEELFAELESAPEIEVLQSEPDANGILPGFRKLIQEEALPDQVTQLFLMAPT